MAQPESQAPALTFEVYRGSTLIKRVDLREPSITIGRGASALLQVDDDALAELHAVLNVEDDGTLSLLDLGSESGVSYRGERISNAQIGSGEAFEVGALRFVVSVEGVDPFDDEGATQVADALPAALMAHAEEQHHEVAFEEDDVTEESEELPEGFALDGESSDDELPLETEDVLSFIMRSGTAQSGLGVNKNRPKVLEVNQLWGEVLLDTKHFSGTEPQPISIGSSVGWRWYFLGVDMGWVPTPLSKILPYTPPMWSEVTSDWRNEFYAPDGNLPGGNDHVLFEHDSAENKYVAKVAMSWDGFVDIGDDRFTFDELADAGRARKAGGTYEIPIDEDVRLMVDVDGVVFFSQMVYPGTRMLDRRKEDTDYPFMAIFSFMGFLGLMFGVVMYFSPKPAANEMVEIPDRFVELLLERPEPEEKKKNKPDRNPDAGEGAKAKKEEGKVGKKDAKMDKAKGNKVEVKKRELDRKIAENAGVLGALNDAGDLDGVFGNAGLNANLTGGIGGLIGAKGTQIGSGGLGARGSGLGGGGTADGLGGLGTKGIGSGASGYGAGGGNFGAKGDGGIGTVGGDPIILGALDRSLIDEVVKRHMNQIRYCYQRELTKNPALNGKIVIKFVIAKDGTVSSASKKSSTMGNAGVEQCVAGRFMRMQFPEPKGGGIVIVSYPFIFAPG